MTEKPVVQLTLRMPEDELRVVEDWRRQQARIPSFTVALRTLIECGAKAEMKLQRKAG